MRLSERLEAQGWVERRPSGGRATALHLTAAGEELLARVRAARAAALDALLQPLPEGEIAALAVAAEDALAAATTDRPTLERLRRLCERDVCERCPVSGSPRRRLPGL